MLHSLHWKIGALGHSLPQTHSDLKGGLPYLTKRKVRHLFDEAGKISITCSQSLFLSKDKTSLEQQGSTNINFYSYI